MNKRWGAMALALGFAIAAALTPTAATAAPVEPDAAVNATIPINKLKSIWGGGWVLNIGQSEGNFAEEWPAQLWFNVNNDWNNRFKVRNGQIDGWYMYENLFTHKCLAASGSFSGAKVVQRTCSEFSDAQRWRLAGDTGFQNGYMPVRNKMVDADVPFSNLVMAQQAQAVGSLIVMKPFSGAQTQWWKSFRCGDVLNGGIISTPASC
jgi:hypothetical protein